MDYYPAITANAYLKINPLDNLYFLPRVEYVGARYLDSSGLIKKLEEYCLLSVKVVWDVCDYFSISAGVSTILDTYYEIKQYAPLGGRTYSLSFTTTY